MNILWKITEFLGNKKLSKQGTSFWENWAAMLLIKLKCSWIQTPRSMTDQKSTSGYCTFVQGNLVT